MQKTSSKVLRRKRKQWQQQQWRKSTENWNEKISRCSEMNGIKMKKKKCSMKCWTRSRRKLFIFMLFMLCQSHSIVHLISARPFFLADASLGCRDECENDDKNWFLSFTKHFESSWLVHSHVKFHFKLLECLMKGKWILKVSSHVCQLCLPHTWARCSAPLSTSQWQFHPSHITSSRRIIFLVSSIHPRHLDSQLFPLCDRVHIISRCKHHHHRLQCALLRGWQGDIHDSISISLTCTNI